MAKSGKRQHRRADHAESVITNTPSTSTAVQTPRSHDDGDMPETPDEDMDMTVEEAMDMGSEDDLDDTGDEDDGDDGDDGDDAQGQENIRMRPPDGPPIHSENRMVGNEMEVDDTPLVISQMRPPPSSPPLPMAQG
jgi:hypothetical protein